MLPAISCFQVSGTKVDMSSETSNQLNSLIGSQLPLTKVRGL